MTTRISPGRLAVLASRRPWRTLAACVTVVTVTFMLAVQMLGSALTNESAPTNNPESRRAEKLVAERLGDDTVDEVVVLQSDRFTVDDPAFRERLAATRDAARAAGVAELVTYLDAGDASLVSGDRQVTVVAMRLPDTGKLGDHRSTVGRIVEAGSGDGVVATSFGEVSIDRDFETITDEDLAQGETIGIGVALVVLVAVFGALIASLLPLATAVVAITLALGVAALIGLGFDLNLLITNMITMMGLAVGIDYSLFIVSRYREERQQGVAKLDAIAVCGRSASRAVVFSGLTVVIALMGMLLVPFNIFRSLALGAILVVLCAVAAALTLLPALLSLLGDRIERGRIGQRRARSQGGPFWDGVARTVMRRPITALTAGTLLLLLLASPALDLRTGYSGVDLLPDESPSRQAFDILAAEFSGGLSEPVEVVVDGDPASADIAAAVAALEERLTADATFGRAAVETHQAEQLTIVSAPIEGNPTGRAALDAVGRARDNYVPEAFGDADAEILVGGEPAVIRDMVDTTNDWTPPVIAFVLGLSFLLLTAAFRSLVVPIKAMLMNLLSVGAAYGVVVLVSQKGVGAGVLGFRQVEAIEVWLPLFLFSVLFGLSMDYHVFLLSRIRERYLATGDNTESVAHGLRTTGRLITGAALIMVAVFGGFASGRLADLQQTGLGLAVAVALDATIVRVVLVPASMRLLGRWNWYFPRWLEWIPRIGIEAPEPVTAPTPRGDATPVRSGSVEQT
ncbi:MAG TPA: MMPL family transporter [Acidimicrobiales bacterium]|nr:MMPL family transporter [Acidimicrobiales bacterium]